MPFVAGWLRLAHRVARPLARAGVSPSVLTGLGAGLAWASAGVAAAPARWPLAAAGLILLSAWCDALDGAVAIVAGRVSRGGALLDALADRVSDAACGVALWAAGGPGPLAAAWVGTGLLAEYARSRGQSLANGPVDVVTVGERPTRVIVTLVTLVAVGVAPGQAVPLAFAGLVVGLLAAVAGLAQVLLALRRRLR